MTVIGLMGAMNVGKEQILRMFVDFVIKHDCGFQIDKKDFKGETEIEVKDGYGFSNSITTNKVVFTDIKTGLQYTIFAPGGDRDHAGIRMGIITISRVARKIIGVFAVNQDLKDQFKLYDLVRYMPENIHICLTKCDQLIGTDEEKQQNLEKMKEKIKNYFKKRRIRVNEFCMTYFETNSLEMINHNNHAMELILYLATGRFPSIQIPIIKKIRRKKIKKRNHHQYSPRIIPKTVPPENIQKKNNPKINQTTIPPRIININIPPENIQKKNNPKINQTTIPPRYIKIDIHPENIKKKLPPIKNNN